MAEKLKRRTLWLARIPADSGVTESAAALLRDVRGVREVNVVAPHKLSVSYNVRQITLQTIIALLREFDYHMHNTFYCRMVRSLCYYFEDIECTECKHDQAECTRDAFINRYLTRPHGCRDHRPDYQRRYL